MVGQRLEDPFCDPENPHTVTFEEITAAVYKIKPGIRHTDCTESLYLTNLTGMNVYLKKEITQPTGSFRERGVRCALLGLSPDIVKRGIVTASSGNHAQACCYHGFKLNIPVTVFLSEQAAITKVEQCRSFGGNVVVQGRDFIESRKKALDFARENGLMYLNGNDHPDIIAGNGTIGLEICEQVPDLDAVIVPVGGGSLIAGICVAVKSLNKNIQVISVENERAPGLIESLKKGMPVDMNVNSRIEDGFVRPEIGVNSFATVKNLINKSVVVKEQYIALSILKLGEHEKCVVEGNGGIGLAAILQGTVPELKGKKVCLILTGGNIDVPVFGLVLERGLAAEGRLVKVKVFVPDRVGGIQELVDVIGSYGVHIRSIWHERAWITEDVFKVEVKVICECRNRQHSLLLRDGLVKTYGSITFNGVQFPPNSSFTTSSAASNRKYGAMKYAQSEFEKASMLERITDFDNHKDEAKAPIICPCEAEGYVDDPSKKKSRKGKKKPVIPDEDKGGLLEQPVEKITSSYVQDQSYTPSRQETENVPEVFRETPPDVSTFSQPPIGIVTSSDSPKRSSFETKIRFEEPQVIGTEDELPLTDRNFIGEIEDYEQPMDGLVLSERQEDDLFETFQIQPEALVTSPLEEPLSSQKMEEVDFSTPAEAEQNLISPSPLQDFPGYGATESEVSPIN